MAEYQEERRLRIGNGPAGQAIPPSVAQVTGTGVPALTPEQVLEVSGTATRKGVEPPALPVEDVRGQAGVTPQGTVVRGYKGSKRPPDIDPYVWTMYTRKQRADEVARYEKELETRRKSQQAGTDGPPAAGNPHGLAVPSAAEVSGPEDL